MLRWALAFFILALIAALFGFGGVAEASADVAQLIFFAFVVVFVISLVGGLFQRRRRLR